MWPWELLLGIQPGYKQSWETGKCGENAVEEAKEVRASWEPSPREAELRLPRGFTESQGCEPRGEAEGGESHAGSWFQKRPGASKEGGDGGDLKGLEAGGRQKQGSETEDRTSGPSKGRAALPVFIYNVGEGAGPVLQAHWGPGLLSDPGGKAISERGRRRAGRWGVDFNQVGVETLLAKKVGRTT